MFVQKSPEKLIEPLISLHDGIALWAAAQNVKSLPAMQDAIHHQKLNVVHFQPSNSWYEKGILFTWKHSLAQT